MPDTQKVSHLPELVFGIVGPMGVNMETICDSLANALRAVNYSAHPIHLTKEMLKEDRYKLQKNPVPQPTERNFYTDVNFKINYANALCKEFSDAATMARIAIRAIGDERERLTGDRATLHDKPSCWFVEEVSEQRSRGFSHEVAFLPDWLDHRLCEWRRRYGIRASGQAQKRW
ncbi:hypothetical protein [Bradyrhizobium sp. USDA 4451]